MKNTQKARVGVAVLALVAGLALPLAPVAWAQAGLAEANAVSSGMDTLNGGPVTPAGGMVGMDRARNVAGQAQASVGATNGAMAGAPAAPAPAGGPNLTAAPAAAPAADPNAPAGTATPGAAGKEGKESKITVITGTRVFDVVSKVMIDDAVVKRLPETERKNYFDDGTHGDVKAGDKIYTKVDVVEEGLGQANQRVKEQLVQSLIVAEGYEPTQFFGLPILSMDRGETPASRKTAWRLTPVPNSPGFTLAEQPVEKPLEVPKYREKLSEKDKTVKSDWSYRFLSDFRINKDDLASEFHPLYIPVPPQVPDVAPPVGWTPFADPGAVARDREQRLQQAQQRLQQMYGGSGGGGGMGAMSMGGGGMR